MGIDSPDKRVLRQPEHKAPQLGDNVMNAQEYSGIRHESPYIFELTRNGKKITYFGSDHVSDPNNTLFAQIRSTLEKAAPDLVLVEGVEKLRERRESFHVWLSEMSESETIEQGGEPLFAVRLALEKGIECNSPEPSDEFVHEQLIAKGYTPDEIFAYELFRVLPQYYRRGNGDSFREYAQPFLDRFKRSTEWRGYDYSYENALRIGEAIVGHPVDVESDEMVSEYVDPIPRADITETALNRVGRVTSHIRDCFAVEDIARELHTHDNIFIIFGHSHAVMHEPALRKLFSNSRE